MSDPNETTIVSLNNLLSSQQTLTAKVISDFLMRRHLGGLANGNCASAFCDCNAGYCSCHGSVNKEFTREEIVSLPELEKLRHARIEQLKAQIKALEGN